MKVLGLTSGMGLVGAAIAMDSGVLSECSISSRITQSEKLIPLANDVLKKTGIRINDIDAVAVTIGPGSYSGLRGGLAAAKGLVEALKVPIITVSTMHAIAYNFTSSEGTIAVAVNACRDDYNFSLWGADRGELKRLTADITVKMGKIIEVLSEVKGKMILSADETLKKAVKNDNILMAEEKGLMPWAVNVASIGLKKLKAGEVADYITVSPEYSHKPNIREFSK